MYKYEIWYEGGMLHESEPIYKDYEEAEVDAKADAETYNKSEDSEVYFEIKEV